MGQDRSSREHRILELELVYRLATESEAAAS